MILLRRVQLTAWLASHRDADIAHRVGETYTAGTVRLAKRFVEGGLVELLGTPGSSR